MAKTLLKMVLGIIFLAAVIFAGLNFWEKYQERSRAPQATSSEETTTLPSIRDIRVLASGEGALIQVSDVGSPNYRVSSMTRPNGVVIEVPSCQVTMTPNVVARPHALVPLIEAVPTFVEGVSGAKIRIELAAGTTFKDRLVGGTLFVDVSKTGLEKELPKVATKPKKKIVKKKATKKWKPKKKSAKKWKPKKKARVVKKAPTAAPAWAEDDLSWDVPEGSPPSAEDTELMKELGLDDPVAKGPKPEREPEVGLAPEVPIEDDETDELSSLYYEEPTPGPAVASAPLSSGRFDSNEVTKDFPAIRGLEVFSERGVTTIQIDRETKTKYQVFRMVNPTRLIIDFKNALNQLQPSYSGFAGTRVQKVTTRQFVGPEGTISRVILFVDGKTDYKHQVKGSTLILRLP